VARRDPPRDRGEDGDAQRLAGRPRGYFPREVFFFDFGFGAGALPAAAARAFCFFVAIRPPVAVAKTARPKPRASARRDAGGPPPQTGRRVR
jgi:hypothetical protein